MGAYVTKKHWSWLFLALLHLGLSTAGCLNEDLFQNAYGSAFRHYGYFSGGMARLKFFSPDVGSELRLTYQGPTAGGKFLEGSILTARGETNLRLAKLVDIFWSKQTTPAIRQSLAASWAGKILAQHPELVSVTLHLDAFELPGMAAYRAGLAPRWLPYYQASFERAGHGFTAQTEKAL
jgi:hypothetical protein